MKFEDIKQDMLISYKTKLYRVVKYYSTNDKYWSLEGMTGRIIIIFIDDRRLPKLSIFDIDNMVEL